LYFKEEGNIMSQNRRPYPSDLTDQQWNLIKRLVPKARSGGRPRKVLIREIINAVFYLTRTGCAWRYLPADFPHWRTVYDYFRRFCNEGVWGKIESRLHESVRQESGLEKDLPSYTIIDSQSVKAQYGELRGYDGFKKVRGRKRHIIVDSLGIPIAVKVSSANASDADEGFVVLERAKKVIKFDRLEEILVDGGYKKVTFFENVIKAFKIIPTIRNSKTKPIVGKREGRRLTSSNLKPRRWIVERTFAWFINFRRLNRDYERKIICSEAMIYIAATVLLLQRLAPK
jgi:putative transposase